MTNEEAIVELRDIETDDPQIREAYDLAIAALERDRWISRPPTKEEADGYVLAVVNGRCGNTRFRDALLLAEYDAEYGEWFNDEYPDAEFLVKAWRPLPEPPKED